MRKLILTILVFLFASGYSSAGEIVSKRTYNQKVFSSGVNKNIYRISAGHVHYKENGQFKDADFSLRPDLTGRWVMDKANYNVTIPEFSDEEFIFLNRFEENNQTIRATPQAAHVKGQKDGDWIIYSGAFGSGVDLRVRLLRSGLLKVISVNEQPTQIEDLSFKFNLNLAARDKIVDRLSGLEWTKTSLLDFTGKELTIGRSNNPSYFRKAKIWDSTVPVPRTIPAIISLEKQGSDLVLTKTIPAAFLSNAVYPVYTDHPTSYYSGAGDGGSFGSNTGSWTTAHDKTTGDGADSTATLQSAYSRTTSFPTVTIQRAFIPIDTSGIDDGATITAAVLNIYVAAGDTESEDDDGDDFMTIVQTFQASTTEVITADYDQCGDAIDDPTEGIDVGERKDIATDFTSDAYNSFTLNATGIGWINKTGTTQLGIREGHDVLDNPIVYQAGSGSLTYSYMAFSTSEETGTGQDPYLEVTTVTDLTHIPQTTIY